MSATICALARANEKDVQKAIDALKDAERSRLHVFIAISELHMEYKLKMTRQEVLDKVKSVLAYAKGKVDEIEFSGEDAARSGFRFRMPSIWCCPLLVVQQLLMYQIQ